MPSGDPISRRSFAQRTAVAAGLAAVNRPAPAIAATRKKTANVSRSFLTPADEFYDVSRGNPKPHTLRGGALAEAKLTPETWRLEVTADPLTEPPGIQVAAEVEKPLTLDLPKLLELGRRHGVKYVKAMQCLNIAEPLGQGLWEGVPLRDVLRLCGRINNVRRIYYRGFHNHDPKQIFQSSVSYTQAMETPPGDLPVFLAYRLNGEPIPPERGGPVRMIVPWAHGFKSIKWLQQIFLTNDYRINDTYALRNNDPESHLKTAAYVEGGPAQVAPGEPVVITGQVISGLSGLDRVETFLRKSEGPRSRRLSDHEPELLRADWRPCEILPPPDWESALPDGITTKDLLGFDRRTGRPLSWPLRYGMAAWQVTLRDLKPGSYELYARAVDRNGFAQPEPRPARKTGKNEIQHHRFTVA
jgi:DMSO/TMAO reductase YedYZ molybdopterin-dependent catalytic subunit